MSTQKTYCVSHELPLVPDTLFDYAVGIGDFRPRVGVHVSTLDPFWDRMRPLAYGAAGNYVIPRAITNQALPTELTGIFSHRKIVVRSTIGRPAVRYPVYREISCKEAALLPAEEARPRDGHDFLIGSPVQFPHGVITQYANMHHPIDLFEYLSIAVNVGVMTQSEVREFSLNGTFIPGGCELGIYPTPWLYEVLTKLEILGREFVTRCGERVRTYDAYQVRAVGFLAERLGSYFLVKELGKRFPSGIPRALIGCLCVIVSDGEAYSGAITR